MNKPQVYPPKSNYVNPKRVYVRHEQPTSHASINASGQFCPDWLDLLRDSDTRRAWLALRAAETAHSATSQPRASGWIGRVRTWLKRHEKRRANRGEWPIYMDVAWWVVLAGFCGALVWVVTSWILDTLQQDLTRAISKKMIELNQIAQT